MTEGELKAWIKKAQKKYVYDSVERQWQEFDLNQDGFISWDEYRNVTYGTYLGKGRGLKPGAGPRSIKQRSPRDAAPKPPREPSSFPRPRRGSPEPKGAARARGATSALSTPLVVKPSPRHGAAPGAGSPGAQKPFLGPVNWRGSLLAPQLQVLPTPFLGFFLGSWPAELVRFWGWGGKAEAPGRREELCWGPSAARRRFSAPRSPAPERIHIWRAEPRRGSVK